MAPPYPGDTDSSAAQPLLPLASNTQPAKEGTKKPLTNENGVPFPFAMTGGLPRDEVPIRYFDLGDEEDPRLHPGGSTKGVLPAPFYGASSSPIRTKLTREVRLPDQDPFEDRRLRLSLAPDTAAIRIRHIAERFRSSMLVLLGVNIVFYSFEGITGLAIVPTSQEMIILLLGWFGQDQYRVSSLNLYFKLMLLSIFIDTCSFLTTVVVILNGHPEITWAIWIFATLFMVETIAKVPTLNWCQKLTTEITLEQRVPYVANV